MKLSLALAAAVLVPVLFVNPAAAAPSTSKGQVSVAQLDDLLSRAADDNAVRNALVAYLAGVGETAGLLLGEANAMGKSSVACAKPLSISDTVARAALDAADSSNRAETPATPILVADMLKRAGCR